MILGEIKDQETPWNLSASMLIHKTDAHLGDVTKDGCI